MTDAIGTQGRNLEDAFFRKKDALLIQKRKEFEEMERNMENLSKVSGIANKAILKKLVELDVHPELIASLAVVPVVEVAWADGEVQEKEREAVLAGLTQGGIGKPDIDRVLVEQWLRQRPPPKLMDAWIHYVEGLCEALSPEERDGLKTDVLNRTRAVAEAAGGFLGLTSRISDPEKEVLDKLAAAFEPKKAGK